MAGLLCVHLNDEKRPTMKEAGRMLKGGMVPKFPLKKLVGVIQSVMPERSVEIMSRYDGIEEVETPYIS